MIAPKRLYEKAPVLSPEEAADMVVEAIIRQTIRIAAGRRVFGEAFLAIRRRRGGATRRPKSRPPTRRPSCNY